MKDKPNTLIITPEIIKKRVDKRFPEVISLIESLSSHYSKKFMKRELKDDLFQEGYLALFKAVKLYDEDFNVKFKTYFSWWLRHALISYCMKNIYSLKIPMDVVTIYKKINSLQEEGKEINEICKELKITEKKYKKTLAFIDSSKNPLFFAYKNFGKKIKSENVNFQKTLVEECPDPKNLFEEIIEKTKVNDYYLELFKLVLTPLEYQVITRHFGFLGNPEPLNRLRNECSPLGKNFTREWLRQKKESAFKKIKPYIEELRNEYITGKNNDEEFKNDQF